MENKARFELICENIYRLKVPFENIYTSVFLIKDVDGWMLCDCATTAQDVADIILPAISDMEIELSDITHILLTHAHGDHAGGLRYLLPHMPYACVCAGAEYVRERLMPESFILLSDGISLSENITAIPLPGHSGDSFGYLDGRSGTLISGDGVQLCGVGRYGCGLGSFAEYENTLRRIKCMGIARLVTSHDYYPLGAVCVGDGEIHKYLSWSYEYAEYISRVCDEYISRGVYDQKQITDDIRQRNERHDSNIPPLQYSTVKNCIIEKTK